MTRSSKAVSPPTKSLPGVYVLLFNLSRDLEISVGSLGIISFPAGSYGYVGSGMKGVEARVRRHLRPHLRPSWHLDYLLPYSKPKFAVVGHTTKALECPLAESLGIQLHLIPRFGSSDCRCRGHLFRGEDATTMSELAEESLFRLGCVPIVLPLPLEEISS